MPRGYKPSYTGRQNRQAEHIEKGYEKRGREAARRAWAPDAARRKIIRRRAKAGAWADTRRPADPLPPARARPRRPRQPASGGNRASKYSCPLELPAELGLGAL
jgi:hypothetical protein